MGFPTIPASSGIMSAIRAVWGGNLEECRIVGEDLGIRCKLDPMWISRNSIYGAHTYVFEWSDKSGRSNLRVPHLNPWTLTCCVLLGFVLGLSCQFKVLELSLKN